VLDTGSLVRFPVRTKSLSFFKLLSVSDLDIKKNTEKNIRLMFISPFHAQPTQNCSIMDKVHCTHLEERLGSWQEVANIIMDSVFGWVGLGWVRLFAEPF